METLTNDIGGVPTPPAGGAYLERVDPATGEPAVLVPQSGAEDVEAAVGAASRAFPDWSATPAAERSQVLVRLADLIERDLESLARLESRDTGKPIGLARSMDIPRAAQNFRFFATAILHTATDAHLTDQTALNYTLRRAPRGGRADLALEPAALSPHRGRSRPALATGNTAVAKPSELTPSTAHRLAELAREAGLPRGRAEHRARARRARRARRWWRIPPCGPSPSPAARPPARRSPGRPPRCSRSSPSSWAERTRPSSSPTRTWRRCSRRCVRSAFANQGEICLCGSRILDRGLDLRPIPGRVRRGGWPAFGSATRSGRDHRPGRGDQRRPSRQDPRLPDRSPARKAARILTRRRPPAELPARVRNGYFLAPTVIVGPAHGLPHQPGGDLRPGGHAHALRRRGPCRGAGQRLAPTAWPASLWTSDLTRAHRVARRVRMRHGLGELLAPPRSPRALRRHEAERRGPGRRRRGAAVLHRGEERVCEAVTRWDGETREGGAMGGRARDRSGRPAPVGAYPHARRVGNLLFLSGIGPRVPGTDEIPGNVLDDDGPGGRTTTSRRSAAQVFDNVRAILEDAGSSWDRMVDVTVFLTDMAGDFSDFQPTLRRALRRQSAQSDDGRGGSPADADRDRAQGDRDGRLSAGSSRRTARTGLASKPTSASGKAISS